MTQGVWLPIALADLYAALFGLARMWAKNPDAVEIPKRGEILKGWALPVMGEAIEADEKEAEAFRLVETIRNMAAKQRGK